MAKDKVGSFRVNKIRYVRLVMVTLFIVSMSLFFIAPIAVADDAVLLVNISSDYDTREPGKTITFDITYSNSSTTVDAVKAKVTYTLPAELAYVANSTGGSAHVDHVDVSGDQVTFFFVNPLPAGSTGYVQVMVQFPNGTTPDNLSVDNTVDFTADNAAPVTSTVTVTSDTKSPDWYIAKSKITPPSDPVPGQPVSYQIRLNGNSSGGLNLHDVRIEDRLPANISDVTASHGGIYDSFTGKVTWDIGDLNVGSSVTRDITYTYSYDDYTTSSQARNDADGFGQLYGDTTEISVTNFVTHGFSAPLPTTEVFRKSNRPSQTDEEYSIGQTAIYELDRYGNSGNVPLDDFYIEDAIPPQLDLTSITTGRTNTGQDVTISYQSKDTTDWQPWTTQSTSSNTTFDVSSLGLAPGDYVTNVRWHYGTVPVGFNDSGDIRLYATILAVNREDGVTPVTEVRNTSYLYWKYEDLPQFSKASNEAKFITTGQRPWFYPRKAVADDTMNYGDTVEYTLWLRNHQYATGTLDNPIGIDVLPIYVDPDDGSYDEVLENVTWTWNMDESGLDQSIIDALEDPVITSKTITIDGKNRTVIKWEFNDSDVKLAPGKYIEIKLKGVIKDQTHTGIYTNNFYQTTNATSDIKDLSALVSDINDLDDDGQVDDKLYPVSRDLFVIFQGSLESDKWVKGELDTVWTQYADPNDGVGNTLPGGIGDYQLHVRNPGSNGPISNLVIIDLLPRIGDTGLIDTSTRDTKWNPYLVDRIKGENGAALPAGMTVYYSTNPNPSMSELYDPENNNGSAGDGWSTTPPEDITTVRSLKIDFGSIEFEPGDTIIVEWPMRAPIGAPVGEIAWNSFAYTATYPGYQNGSVVNKPFLPAEPTKVGFKVQPPPGATVDLGNYVWHDLDADGIQDSGEEGINGVIVNLYRHDQTPGVDAPIAFTRSGDHHSGIPGYYGFPDLPTGDYYVEFIYPERYYLSPEKTGTNDAVDSDGLLASKTTSGGLTHITTGLINVNADNYNVDLGLYLATAIGDTVWIDKNNNGIQDSGEAPVAGVTVSLTDTSGNTVNDIDGNPVADDTTDSNGKYGFTNLRPGNYRLTFSNIPSGYVYTSSDVGDDSDDSDTNAGGIIAMVSVASTRSDMTFDAGIHAASLGNYVWLDINRDGIQNAGDLPIQGLTVWLLNDLGTELDNMTTDSSGHYMFEDIAPGDYRVKFDISPGFMFADQLQGGDTTTDSDPDTSTGTTALVNLVAGEIDDTVDAGLCYIPSSLGDYVWRDTNIDGQQDAGEVGIDGVTVHLLDSSDNILRTTTTEGGGQYLFDILNPGDYKVQVVAPTNYVFTGKDEDSDDNLDSDVIIATGITDTITLGIDEHNMSIDAGLYALASLGNKVWVDEDRDGRQDNGEPCVSGVQVDLLDASSAVINTMHTDSSGEYLFTSLYPGTYSVKFTLLADYIFTEMDKESDDALDSDANTTTGVTAQVTLAEGDINDTLDAGIVPLYSVGDRIWIDDDTDGVQDSGELDKNGVTVYLMDAVTGLEVANTVTAMDAYGNNGYYLFENVPMGKYYIRAALPTNYSITKVNQGSNDQVDSDGYIAASMARTESFSLDQDIVVVDLGLVDLIRYPDWVPPYGPVQNPKTGDFE